MVAFTPSLSALLAALPFLLGLARAEVAATDDLSTNSTLTWEQQYGVVDAPEFAIFPSDGSSRKKYVRAPPGAFQGPQSGIGSWFRANSKSDSTTGKSWCGYKYSDSTPGFAPDISQMTEWTNAVYPNAKWSKYASMYCGREAQVTDPQTGKTSLLFITDAFDHQWVRSPGSIDIHLNAWRKLKNSQTNDKNTVIKPVNWHLTGRISAQYAFKGKGG
ncbi:uncharacterized protein EV422DRAFT_621291 [Fimicolochytrium jonesii]|uniref:uncharacterized protein n=1 Tax=Fimicolochytrium jonesii TaxID=1396493 RepID=UPI0022FEB2AF|nr:uncharacterized protein EV422DRAFT_621291 [Fimicolochytrium jonesii]KAI8819170.1 hypothetical protein EV422DRAFT_621291 [Fimicolochytrium jonesii]